MVIQLTSDLLEEQEETQPAEEAGQAGDGQQEPVRMSGLPHGGQQGEAWFSHEYQEQHLFIC